MDWKAELASIKTGMGDFASRQAATQKGFSALHGASLAEGVLSTKQKELISLAIGIARQCSYCIGLHVQACIAAGATRAEIEETVNVSVLMGGGPSLMYGLKALEAFDQLAA
ncbi:MAG: carboxymuconolactone decarboxylase family protein [Sphingomonadales bacterium]|nr:carboxymuconolactone decarboxylase family protein [Sphingomonadales bacterium]